MTHLAHIHRHPIKSIGYEVLTSTSLSQGRVLPFDRLWAVAHEAAKFDGQPTQWVAKHNFLRGVAGSELMAVKATLDESTQQITLSHPAAQTITLAPKDDGDHLIAWLLPLWPENRPGPDRVVSLSDGALTDVPEPYVSIASTASLTALSADMQQDLSMHRFRGNLWVEGWNAFEELDMVGQTVRIGACELKIEARIKRCRATTGNPDTGKVDAETLDALNANYGHQDFGVYARVMTSGTVALNDQVEVL